MTKFIVTILLILFTNSIVVAQKQSTASNTPTAVVEVIVVDEKGRPRKGELIWLEGHANKKKITGRTNESGRLKATVPAGDEYAVMVKALADSEQYGKVEIPSLKAGEQFNGSFEVEIMYEPAKLFTLNNVQFDVGKASLRPASFKELNELVEYLKWKDGQKIEIAGHTDNTGNEKDNQELSQNRANTVKSYLLTKGIKPQLVMAKGYGASQPIADNATALGKQKNRRTEVRLIE